MGWNGVRVNLLKHYFTRSCIKCPELYRKVIFANLHPTAWGISGVNFKIKFSLLGLNEMSKLVGKSHFSNPYPSLDAGRMLGVNLQKKFFVFARN